MAYLQVSNVEIDSIANARPSNVYVATRELFCVSMDELIAYRRLGNVLTGYAVQQAMETYSLPSGSMEWSPKYARYMAIIIKGLFGASLKSRSQAALKSGPRPATSSSVGLNLPAERWSDYWKFSVSQILTYKHP